MNLLSLVLTAFGLSMDAFAVSITSGMRMNKITNKNAAKIAIYMGGFQGIMPVIGWALGLGFKDYITSIDHWIALILLSIIGGNMIYEAVKEKRHSKDDDREIGDARDNSKDNDKELLKNKVLLLLAVATSIDALAVGVSFAFLNISIISSSLIIAIITFTMCFIGVKIGKKCGGFLKGKAEIVGGVILMLIGINIFLEHMNFWSLLK